jgi:CRP-like cAMP-binding protein
MRRTGRQPPALARHLLALLTWLVSLTALASVVFDVSLTGAIATSSVVLAVLGFALRNLIADLFYGITMALERPFDIGDWIATAETTAGRVEAFTWRAVRLVTRDNVTYVLPNSLIAGAQIVNYDKPDPECRAKLRVPLGHDVEPARAKRILLYAVQQVAESAAIARAAEAVIVDIAGHTLVWELRFWVPDFSAVTRVTQAVHEVVLWNLAVADIALPRDQEEVLVDTLSTARTATKEAQRGWLRRNPLLVALRDDGGPDLLSRRDRRTLREGEILFSEGDAGSSLFLLHEGSLVVSKTVAGERQRIASVRPGDVVGELSLLTGAPRSATVQATAEAVLLEIGRDDLQPILERRPELALRLADVASAHRRADVDRERAAATDMRRETRQTGVVQQLTERIRAYFQI